MKTDIGQLVARCQDREVRVRDWWHLCLSWLRKLLSHPFAFELCQRSGPAALRAFAELLTDPDQYAG